MKQTAKAVLGSAASLGFGAAGALRRSGGNRVAPDLSRVRSILAIRVNLLGDVLFTLPAVAALREAAPNARITMAVLPYTAELLRGSKIVDRTISIDVNGWRSPAAWASGRAPRGVAAALAALREEPYDLAVSFYGRAGSAIAVASGAGYTVGYEGEGYAGAFDLSLPGTRYQSGQHESEYCLDLARALGAPASGSRRLLDVDRETTARLGEILAGTGVGDDERLVAVHPGALNMAAKRWLPGRWAEVADRIQRELGARVVLVGSSSETPLANVVQRCMSTRPVALTGKTSLPELAALLRRCSLFLGGDSGPLHLASALDVPSVSIYGPTDPANTGPLGTHSSVLRGTAPCIPCYDLSRPATCWRGDLTCMSSVSSEEVFAAAKRALETGEGGRERGRERGSEWGSEGGRERGREWGGGSNLPLPLVDLAVASAAPRPLGGRGEGCPSIPASPTRPLPHSPTPTLPQQPTLCHCEPAPDTYLRRILIVKLAGIGDMLTAFPAMEAIRAKYPISEITALVTPQSAPVLDGAGLVDRVIEFDKYAFDGPGGLPQLAASTELLRLAARLRTRSYDAVLLLHHLVTWPGIVKYAALTLGSGARVRAGLDDGRGRFLTLRAKDRGFGAKHEVEYWLEVAGLIGARTLDPAVRLRWGEAEDEFADRAWSAMGLLGADRVVAIHPGTGSYSPARRWPAERFSAVANALSEEGLVPVVVAGPGEEDLADLVCRGIRGRHTTLRGTPTPRHLAAVLARCDLFIGNDSGVTHVARAVGVPTVAIFGPSNHRAWAPYSLDRDLTRVVRVELPCSPCLYRGQSLGLRNGCGDPQCLIRVSPADVLAAAHEVRRGRA